MLAPSQSKPLRPCASRQQLQLASGPLSWIQCPLTQCVATRRQRTSPLLTKAQSAQQQQENTQQQLQQLLQQQHQHQQSLVLPDILVRSCAPQGGRRRYWRIRRYETAKDFQNLAQLQTDNFFVPPGLPLLRSISYVNFRAEVVDSLRQKHKTLDEQTFQIYVADDITDAIRQWPAFNSPSLWSSSIQVPLGPSPSPGSTDPRAIEIVVRMPTELQEGEGGEPGGRELQGTLVGTVEVTLMDQYEVLQKLMRGTEQYAYISSMTVAPSMRRQGLAHALLHVAEQQAKAWSQPDLALHVYTDNEPAVRLYQKCAFQILDRDPDWKKLMGGRTRLLMHRHLNTTTSQ